MVVLCYASPNRPLPEMKVLIGPQIVHITCRRDYQKKANSCAVEASRTFGSILRCPARAGLYSVLYPKQHKEMGV